MRNGDGVAAALGADNAEYLVLGYLFNGESGCACRVRLVVAIDEVDIVYFIPDLETSLFPQFLIDQFGSVLGMLADLSHPAGEFEIKADIDGSVTGKRCGRATEKGGECDRGYAMGDGHMQLRYRGSYRAALAGGPLTKWITGDVF